jgi:hypothetical protein
MFNQTTDGDFLLIQVKSFKEKFFNSINFKRTNKKIKLQFLIIRPIITHLQFCNFKQCRIQ